MPGSLFVVSTPIGNLEDITFRALKTLEMVGLIAAEDTRRTGLLLRHFGISTPTTSFHEHNERQKLPQLLHRLAAGVDIALVSDAGTPLVADPGQRLVAAATDKGVRIVPIPGASAVLSALTASGFPADSFVFCGFVPSRSKDRIQWLSTLRSEHRPIVFFESPHRISRTLSDVAHIFGERPIVVARELTKLHEELIRTTAKTAGNLQVTEKGEFTIVLGPLQAAESSVEVPDPHVIASYFGLMTNSNAGSKRIALSKTAVKFGLSTNKVYALLERLKRDSAP